MEQNDSKQNPSKQKPDKEEQEKIIRKVSAAGIFGNIILSVFKLFAGIYGRSGAMISDAVHSFSDVIATFIAYLGVRLSMRPADREHPYGHERLECVAALILGIVLVVTGLGIGKTGLTNIFFGNKEDIAVPGMIALVAAIVSIATKEAMFWYTRYYAEVIDSPAFKADAWHHRSDALSSVGSLIGIGGAMLGYPVMDSVASVVICLFIFKVSFDILKDAISKMLDTSSGEEYENSLREFVLKQSDVGRVDLLRTRTFGSKIYVDIEIAVDGNKTLREAHDVAERVHEEVEKNFSEVKHIMIHVNPME
ncbi:cation diffusion facilitator family transporter [Lachnospiraceae bacterium XPB1003]|nr:cation diffusion facilitator family transporter [Lachnospiraceae bacterium XPB1003]